MLWGGLKIKSALLTVWFVPAFACDELCHGDN